MKNILVACTFMFNLYYATAQIAVKWEKNYGGTLNDEIGIIANSNDAARLTI